MIVHVIDVNGMSVLEAERQPLISGNRHRVMPFQASFQRMRPETGKVHFVRPAAAIQNREDVPVLSNMLRRHPPRRSSIVKGLESAMFKRPDHAGILLRRLSLVN